MKIFALCFALLFSSFAHAVGSSQVDGDNPRDGAPASQTRAHEGRVIVGIEDDFKRKISRRIYFLREDRGTDVPLLLSDKQGEKLRTGQRIRVTGSFNGRSIDARASSVQMVSSVTAQSVSAATTPTQIRKVVAILIDIADGTGTLRKVSSNCDGTQDKAAEMMFGAVSGGRNVEGCFADASFNNLGFGGQAYPGAVTDVYRVQINEVSNYGNVCNYTAWADAADAAAGSLAGYQHKVYVLPAGSSCSWEGLAYVGCSQYASPCRAWIKASTAQECGYIDAWAHELGHNLGMSHSSTDEDNNGVLDCEYCDTSDIMGYATGVLRTTTAPHKMQMGWLSGAGVVSAASGGTFTLSALEITGAPFPQALTFPTVSGKPYVVSFRAAIGYDSTLPSVGQTSVLAKTSVHRFDVAAGGNTVFIKALGDGESLFDATNAVTFTQVSHDATTTVVRVTLGTTPPVDPCVRANPTVTLSPGSRTISSAQVVSYGVNIQNNDSAQCASSTFALSRTVPSGWMSSLAPGAQTLAPGASASSTLTLTPPINLANGSYGFSVNVAEPAHNLMTVAGSLVMNAPVCQVSNPTMILSPASQTITSVGAVNYTLTVTNNDSAPCAMTTFNLDRVVPAGWGAAFSSSVLGLSPGGAAQTTLTLTPPAGLANGTHAFSASVQAANHNTMSVNGSLVMNAPAAPTCVAGSPTVSLSPSSQTINSIGWVNYTVNVTNNDTAPCATSVFNLNQSIPSGWTGNFSASSVSVAPGAQAQVTFTLHPLNSAPNGSQSFQVGVASNATHSAVSTTGNLIVNIPSCYTSRPVVQLSGWKTVTGSPSTVTFTARVINRDGGSCGAANFTFNAVVPSGWTGSVPSSLTLAPGAFGDIVFTVNVPSVANGLYQIRLSSKADATHDASFIGSAAVIVQAPVANDATPPTAPSGLAYRMVRGSTGIYLSWSMSSDSVSGVSHYQILRNGVVVGVTNALSGTSYAPGGTHVYSVRAVDRAGNVSAIVATPKIEFLGLVQVIGK